MSAPEQQSRMPLVSHPERDESAERRLLERIAQVAARQRTAIIERDLPSLNRLFEALIQLQGDWALLVEERASRGDGQPGASLSALARQIREHLAINRALLANGMAIIDHYIGCIGAAGSVLASPSANAGGPAAGAVPSAALFSGVA